MSETHTRNLKPGEMIFSEGDQGDCAYLVDRGRVLVYIGKGEEEVPLKILCEGEVFGEMSLIDNSPRSASCRAMGTTHLIVVTKDQLLDRIKAADPVVRLLMQALLERLRSQNDILRGKKATLSSPIDPLANQKKEALDRIELEHRIATALDNDEFLPYYQPVYDLNNGYLVGCEALIRWQTKDRGLIPPAMFMDIMEESSLILKAGQAVLEKSTRDLKIMRTRFNRDDNFFVSINVSGRQFVDPRFLDQLEATCARSGSHAHQIKLELTERIMTEGPQALKVLQSCRERGYHLAIDDFGTGFSSLQYLSQMPLTDLKIDRSFVKKMLKEPKSLSIVKSLIYMASHLGLRLIAEGIETAEELAILRELKVSMGQGFLFSKAVPLNDFIKLPDRTLVDRPATGESA